MIPLFDFKLGTAMLLCQCQCQANANTKPMQNMKLILTHSVHVGHLFEVFKVVIEIAIKYWIELLNCRLKWIGIDGFKEVQGFEMMVMAGLNWMLHCIFDYFDV